MSGTPPIPERSDSLPPVGAMSGLANSTTAATSTTDTHNSTAQTDNSDDLSMMENSVVEFESVNFCKETMKTIQGFMTNEQLYDVEIQCGEKSIKCHKLILASVSGYFRSMFMGNMAESKQNVVKIHDIEDTVMENLINFAYKGKILLTVENVQNIMYATSILQIENVANACSDFMRDHLHPDNCIQVHTFAVLHNREHLIKYAEDFIVENFLEISTNTHFKGISPNLMEVLISSSNLHVANEVEVFEVVMSWVESDKDNRVQYLPKLLSHLKLPLLSAAYLMEKVASNDLIRNNLECRDFLDEAKHYQMYLGNLVSDVKLTERTRPRKSYAGVLFCVGGRGASGDPYKSIECYHPMKDRWYQVTEMNTRRRHVGVCSLNGQIYAVGGHNGNKHMSSGEVFDPSTAKWRKIASMNVLRTGVRGLGLACLGGAIYAVGGLDDKTCFDVVERYDPALNIWATMASMNLPRGGVGLASLKGQLYAVGGNDGESSLNNCESYDPYVNKWKPIAPMVCRRAGAGVGVLDTYIYAVGGFDDNASLDSCERYDPRADKWTTIDKLSCPRGGVGVASLGGKLYAVGGHDGCNYLNSVESYNPLTDSWEAVTHSLQCRAGAGLTMLDIPLQTMVDLTTPNMGHLREACPVPQS